MQELLWPGVSQGQAGQLWGPASAQPGEPRGVQGLNAGPSKATGPGWGQPQGLGAGQQQAWGLQVSPQGQGQQLSLSPTTEQQ